MMMKKKGLNQLMCGIVQGEKPLPSHTLAPQIQKQNEDGGRECDHREDGLKTRRSPIDGVCV